LGVHGVLLYPAELQVLLSVKDDELGFEQKAEDSTRAAIAVSRVQALDQIAE